MERPSPWIEERVRRRGDERLRSIERASGEVKSRGERSVVCLLRPFRASSSSKHQAFRSTWLLSFPAPLDFWKNRGLLAHVLKQERGICWAIALVRHYASILKMKGLLQQDDDLSVQELLQLARRYYKRLCKDPLYAVADIDFEGEILKKFGLVSEKDNPLDLQST
ncbi:unnamed protein product [Microthlaspi erraticum]|uniref:Peptidase C1A papain C-terminal domain-containing protein n=1 Tax=Microthlaspi erraticum TaxID=1685480 RepID=A0A6D2JTB0_9BRAS|nr:unnamed protein product [Microthlaspi erraticum]